MYALLAVATFVGPPEKLMSCVEWELSIECQPVLVVCETHRNFDTTPWRSQSIRVALRRMHHSLYQELDLRTTYLGYQDTEFRNLVRNIVLFRAQPHQSSRINQPGRTLKTTPETEPLVADLSVLIRNPCWLFDKFGQWGLPTTHW